MGPNLDTGAHGRGAPVTRTYATKKKKPAAPPGESPEDAKPSDATDKSNPAQSSQTDKPQPPKVRRVKAKEGDKPAPSKKHKAPSPPKASKGPTAPVADHSKEPDETVKLWKETLDILKNLQEPQNVAEGALADQANSNGDGGKKDGADTKRSLKSQFPPLQSAPSNKARERQAKLLEGTLDVLKSVLTAQADRRNGPSKTAKTHKTPGPTTKPKRKQTVNKGAKEEVKTLSGETPEGSHAYVAQGFAALLHQEAEKKAAARDAIPKANNVGKALLGSRSPKTDAHADNTGDVGWGLTNSKRLIKRVKTRNIGLEPVPVDTAPVPRVEYGLDRVLFNEGVYVLQDPRTRVFNFDPYLATIMPVDEFDFEALKQYVTSSKDTTLIGVAKTHNKKFTGSTSSMTSTLAHFHYLLSSWRPINPERISKGYVTDSGNFGAILRAPAATFLHYKDGTYAIDADKEYDSDTILSMLGKSMEKLLTAPKEEYEKYHRSKSHQLTEEERNADESYHYTTFGDFMMRSQLDAYDPRLPGTGVFDLKTRAVVSIRMDAKNHENGIGYEIRQRQGQWESFEREYYDMIRLAFLKYSLQVRMGRMDGIFVAYHNTQRIFGFQYIPLEEMDLSLHGTTDLTTGNREFMASLELWEELLKKATERFPGKSLRIHVETRTSKVVPFMYFFAEPVNDDEIKAIQEKNKEEARKFQERVLGIKPKPDTTAEAARAELDEADEASTGEVSAAEDDAEPKEEAVEEAKDAEEDVQEIDEEDSEDVWEDMMDVVEQTMESDAQGISAIRDAIEDALEQSGLLHARSSEEADQYVEALLKAIVDVGAEKAKSNDDASTEVPQSKSEASGEQKQAQDVSPIEEPDTVNHGDSSPSPPKPSRFGFLASWFGSRTQEADATAKKEPAADTEPSQNINTSSEQESAPKEAAAEADGMESKPIDEKSDDSLKDLLMKLTTRIGSSSDAQKATEELSEDQAKLRNFESILLDMMPKTQEAPAEEAAVSGDEDKKTSEDTPTAGGSGGEGEPAAKPVLGLILTTRNKVNDKYVQRPEKLAAGQKWHVEYTIEELPTHRVQEVYEALKKRRHTAHYKEPGKDMFKTAFDGLLKYYNKAGKKFRQQETEIARGLPVHVKNKSRVGENTEVEGTEKASSSFREWRELDQQKQDTDKEQEQEKEKGS
ncbi:mitochondrial protein Pet127-domain-containing protein [Diaporthe sp. PMI_573]|nr:mitochondrial protein Pet127-domain-containing protein [Diaporthaceae sp. PMI_573]